MDIAQRRDDGWPLCPQCGEDELYAAPYPNIPSEMPDDQRREIFEAMIGGCNACGWVNPENEFMATQRAAVRK